MKKIGKRILSTILAVATLMSCWVWMAPEQNKAAAATTDAKDHYLFAYFTGTSKEGQTIHLAVSKDGYNYTALRNNEACLVPSKGVGNVRDPYIWYNEQDQYYYILATDLDFTDGGGTYSNNSQSFIIWRSKDLVNWYDETFIDVAAMSHLIGDTRNMSAVWAPQVLWDGSAYVVYFTLACNATSWFDIVYLKTTNLLDPNAYYEFDYILGNGTGNGTDNGYGVIDADIIHNPGDGKYYLFYKTECNGHEMGSTATGTSLKTIHYYVGDTPTGPFKNPGDTKWSNAGFSIFPNYNVSLEGCNSFWDNDGNLIMYADEFEHKGATGEDEAYFHIAKSNGYDFTSWTYPDVSQHNINSLSPRHGSVVKITEEEYNRLLNNSYNIKGSSYSADETLEDHLVARYFTTENVLWNDVVGQPNLASSTGITMVDDPSIGYYASFDSTNGGWAEVDFDSLFRKTNGLNYTDGFTITFNAMLQPNDAVNNENNDRIYEIADVFGSRTGTEHYTHFSPGGGGNGSYLGNYNGPMDSGNDWLNDKDRANRDDECFHEYIISYATGNVMVYVDGKLVISRNRFTGVKLDDSWYKALGSNTTMRIGRSGWDADPLFKGRIQDLCIYDCSLSYYDVETLNAKGREQLGWVEKDNYTGITSVVPTFQNTNADRMNSLPNKEQHFSNILYTSETVKNYGGNNMSNDSAVYHYNGNDFYFALYYPETTVLLLDGINDAIMPVSFGSYCENSRPEKGFLQVYPTTGPGSTTDLGELEISQNWAGWYNNGDYYNCIVEHADGYIGRNSSTSSWSHITDKKNYDCHWGAPLKVNADKIDFGGSYYKKFNLTWYVKGGVNGTYAADHSGNMISDNDIYVINFKPILELRDTITEAMYNDVMNNEALCPALREKYANAVYKIRTLDPKNFGFATAPETATKALSKAIGEAVSTYHGVIAEIERQKAAGTYGHSVATFASREATCTTDGLTEGKYCVLCGEIIEEQEVIAPLPHSFGDIYTENGIQYRKCSVCGVRLEYKPYELRYENLFSFNRWYESASNGVFNGTVSTDRANGTITIVNNHNTEIYTRATYDGQNLVSTRDFGNDCIPVEGGRTYVVEATSLSSSTSNGDVFVFQYNKDGLAYQAIPAVIGNLIPGETRAVEFTVDSNAAYIELRFDANDAGKTITYSEIGVYEKENYDRFGSDTANSRLAFYPGDSKELAYPNPSDGYSFDGWYTVAGKKIENINQLNNSTTLVYGKWVSAGYNVVYDSIFSFADWAKSSCNQLWYGDQKDASGNVTRLVSKKGIFTDSENGTITITNDADTTYFARTNYWVDTGNLHKMTVKQNTDYIIEYTASSDDGAKPNVCAYITGGTVSYPESGQQTFYGLGKQYFAINTGNNNTLTLRFDNVQHGSTLTYSGIAVYEATEFQEAAQTITNREYLRYYPQKMGIGDVFEYEPTRPGYTFDTWKADTVGVVDEGDFNMAGFDDSFVVEQNWHLFSQWTENEYTVKFDYNGGSGSISEDNVKYTEGIKLPSEGVSRTGYKLLGWSPVDIDEPLTQTAPYSLSATPSRLNGEPNGTTTLYAVWWKNVYNMTFDLFYNLIDFNAWNKVAGNGTVSDITDTGFTIKCNEGAGEATSASPYFDVEPGKKYRIDMDFEGDNWDVYIFFCDKNGNWIDFKDGPSNRYSSNGSTGIPKENAVFTAPDKPEVVKAQIRVDSNGSNNVVRFENISVHEYRYNPITGYKYQSTDVTYDSPYPQNTFVPMRKGYDFDGWYYQKDQYYNNFGNSGSNLPSLVQFTGTRNLISNWKLNNTALGDDKYVVDFGTTVDLDAITNDTIFTNEALNQNTTTTVNFNGNNEFSLNNQIMKFTPSDIINSAKTITYTAKFVDGDKTELDSNVTIVPASNVLYEENVIVKDVNSSGAEWTTDGSAGSKTQSTADEYVYGYDVMYTNATGNHSNGTAKKVTVNASSKTSEKLTFTFTGTGFELYGACGNNTGVQVIAVRDLDNWTDKTKPAPLVKSAVVDTYYNDTNYQTLYQTPIYNVSGLGYGTYTVEVTAAYLSMAGALKAQSAEVFGTLSTNDNELADALTDLGLDYILEAEDVDVEWFDDNSVLNGGTGANDPTAFGTQSVTSLVNYVDAVRVFEPLAEADENTHYIDSEKNARYYNINDNLMSKSGFIAGGKGFVYVEGNNNFGFDAEDYNSKGSKHEIYLTNASQGENALVFSVSGAGGYNKAMLSLRSATGGDIKVKIGGKELTVSSKTDMYYDITDYVQNGTVTIENATANSLLAIGYLKLTGQAVLESTSDLSSAIEMIETPLGGEETTTGAITKVEYTPSTDSHNTFNVTVNGRPTMIQFIEEDGGTRTYDRNNKNVTIKSYNADGAQVNSLDRTVAYEVWTINTNLTGPDLKVRAKFITDGAYKWEKNPYSFTYEILEPVLDADVRSITPAAVSGKKGAVDVKVVTGPDAQGVRFVMPDGSTCTYNAAKAVTLENGDLEFTGKAWMNEDGLNTISVYIRENNVWNSVGTIEYTAE